MSENSIDEKLEQAKSPVSSFVNAFGTAFDSIIGSVSDTFNINGVAKVALKIVAPINGAMKVLSYNLELREIRDEYGDAVIEATLKDETVAGSHVITQTALTSITVGSLKLLVGAAITIEAAPVAVAVGTAVVGGLLVGTTYKYVKPYVTCAAEYWYEKFTSDIDQLTDNPGEIKYGHVVIKDELGTEVEFKTGSTLDLNILNGNYHVESQDPSDIINNVIEQSGINLDVNTELVTLHEATENQDLFAINDKLTTIINLQSNDLIDLTFLGTITESKMLYHIDSYGNKVLYLAIKSESFDGLVALDNSPASIRVNIKDVGEVSYDTNVETNFDILMVENKQELISEYLDRKLVNEKILVDDMALFSNGDQTFYLKDYIDLIQDRDIDINSIQLQNINLFDSISQDLNLDLPSLYSLSGNEIFGSGARDLVSLDGEIYKILTNQDILNVTATLGLGVDYALKGFTDEDGLMLDVNITDGNISFEDALNNYSINSVIPKNIFVNDINGNDSSFLYGGQDVNETLKSNFDGVFSANVSDILSWNDGEGTLQYEYIDTSVMANSSVAGIASQINVADLLGTIDAREEQEVNFVKKIFQDVIKNSLDDGDVNTNLLEEAGIGFLQHFLRDWLADGKVDLVDVLKNFAVGIAVEGAVEILAGQLNMLNEDGSPQGAVEGAIINFAITAILNSGEYNSEDYLKLAGNITLKTLLTENIDFGCGQGGNQAIIAGVVTFVNIIAESDHVNSETYQHASVAAGVAMTTAYMAHTLGMILSATPLGPIGYIIGYAIGTYLGQEMGPTLYKYANGQFEGMEEGYDIVEDFFKEIFNDPSSLFDLDTLDDLQQEIVDWHKDMFVLQRDFIRETTKALYDKAEPYMKYSPVLNFLIKNNPIMDIILYDKEPSTATTSHRVEEKADGTGYNIVGLRAAGVLLMAEDGHDDDIFGTAGHDVAVGKDGVNVIQTYGGDDMLEGRENNDALIAGDGDDYVEAGSGNDYVDAGAGNDKVYGGDGDDGILGGAGQDILAGGKGNDQIEGEGGSDVIYGGEGDDVIVGGEGNDIIQGQSGNDTIFGEDDNDIIDGGEGDDKVYGEDGDDRIYGGRGSDVLYGGLGNDSVYGEEGVDILYGNLGDDVLDGGKDNDLLYGGFGDDVLVGGEGNDDLYGEFGDDVLVGGKGNDLVDGGENNDIIVGGVGEDELIGGQGDDIYVISAGDGVDTIDDISGDNDIVRFMDYDSSNIEFIKDSDDLIIKSQDSTSNVRVKNHFVESSIELLVFSNSTAIYLETLSIDETGVSSFTVSDFDETQIDEKLRFAYENLPKEQSAYNPYSAWYENNFDVNIIDDEVDKEIYNDVQVYQRTKKRGWFGGHYHVNYDYHEPNLEGTDMDDRIVGMWWDEYIQGYGGDDQIYGNGGNDQLYGGNDYSKSEAVYKSIIKKHDIIRDTFSAKNIKSFDLFNAINKVVKPDKINTIYLSNAHWNIKGHKIIAGILEKVVF